MHSVKETTDTIFNQSINYGSEKIEFTNSLNRVLKEDIRADRPFPPFDRVTMDGIAIKHSALKNGNTFEIEKTIAAGEQQYTLINKNRCIEIMTGASLAHGVDTVIRYEDITINGKTAIINANVIKGQNIHRRGEDINKGDILISKNTRISAMEMNIFATVGKSEILVNKLPKVAIISSGDELVEVDINPLPHQIRKSNVFGIQGLIPSHFAKTELFHLFDLKSDIEDKLKDILNEFDAIILVGGVSKGKFDFIPEILGKLGVKKLIYKVSQRPGKPFWFGTKSKIPVFALPGNPVSSMVGVCRYFLPWLRKGLGLKPLDYSYAILNKDVHFKPDLTRFMEVSLTTNTNGELLATPIIGNGSGDFTKLLKSDGFIELPKGKDLYKKGGVYQVLRFRN